VFSLVSNKNLTRGGTLEYGSKVLVAEGDPATRQNICSVLEKAGFRVVMITESEDTLTRFREVEPDIVVIACFMSGESGIDLCRMLRQENPGSQVPILLTTADADHDLILDGFNAGATDFFSLLCNWSLLPFRVSYLLRAHRTSLQLSASENRQHTLLEGIPDPLLMYNRDCRVVWANHSSSKSLSVNSSSLVGKSCREIWGIEHKKCHNCDILKCFYSGEVVTGTRRSSDGKLWGVRLLPVKNDEGQVENVMKLAHDITDKINLQTESTRTSQLAVIGELAAGVAHEINNPIHGVINYAQIMINKGVVKDEELDLVERIKLEGERVAQIVKSLLGFSRPASSNFCREDLVGVLDESISLFSSKLKSNQIHLEMTTSDGPFIVSARKQQLQQVFVNLISNARYALNSKTFEDPDSKRLQINISRTHYNEKSMLAVRFRDQGCGIPADMLKRIIQPFVTTKPAGHGTGLGLSISDNIIREHGGHLNIESEHGAYTSVTLYLPLEY
jgi:signal transduction histidine kinase/DNA-binding response OmpR family regulator